MKIIPAIHRFSAHCSERFAYSRLKNYKVDIVPASVTNMNGYFTGRSPSFAGLSNKPVVSRRARVGTRPIFPEHSTLGHASSRFPRAFNFRARVSVVGCPEHSILGDVKSSSLALGVG